MSKDTNKEFASSTSDDPEAVKREAARTVPPEFEMEKAGTPEPQPDAYVDSPADAGIVTATHDRDSVQPGPEPRGIYPPEAKLAADADKPRSSER